MDKGKIFQYILDSVNVFLRKRRETIGTPPGIEAIHAMETEHTFRMSIQNIDLTL